MSIWVTDATAVTSSFLASLVEVVEAFTIILAVASLRGWRPAVFGTVAALVLLAGVVLAFGSLLDLVPLTLLQLVTGVLLLLFGTGWLRKAVLRAAGILPLHEEDVVFANETMHLTAETVRRQKSRNIVAGMTVFKAVLLEGLEVVFIVIAVGTGQAGIWPAALGALVAFALVLVIGSALHRPLSRVPENTLKFGVGVMLSAFGVFWTGEGLGIDWPGGDIAIFVFALMFLVAGIIASILARNLKPELIK